MSSPFVPSSHNTFSVSPEDDRLTGLTLAVKDLFHMAGMPTGAGNPDWLATHSIPTTTNSTVERLLRAGSEFVGKTITDELAYSLHGQNIHFSPLINPVVPECIPGGSSSGSAVAVSLGQADIGLGTDTGGSIRVPSSYQGLWGLRPTHGVLPCTNMVGLAPSFDTIGWMTRDLLTMARVTSVCLNSDGGSTNLTANQYKVGVIGGLVEQVNHADLIKTWLEDNQENTKVLFASEILDTAELETANTFRILQGAEIWQEHGDWISQTSPRIAKDIQLRLDWCQTITKQEIQKAKAQQHIVKESILQKLASRDALLIPTTPGIAPRCDASPESLASDRNTLLALTAIAGLSGLPQLHLPLFTMQGAPCGLSLIGKPNSEYTLIEIAKALTE